MSKLMLGLSAALGVLSVVSFTSSWEVLVAAAGVLALAFVHLRGVRLGRGEVIAGVAGVALLVVTGITDAAFGVAARPWAVTGTGSFEELVDGVPATRQVPVAVPLTLPDLAQLPGAGRLQVAFMGPLPLFVVAGAVAAALIVWADRRRSTSAAAVGGLLAAYGAFAALPAALDRVGHAPASLPAPLHYTVVEGLFSGPSVMSIALMLVAVAAAAVALPAAVEARAEGRPVFPLLHALRERLTSVASSLSKMAAPQR